MIAALQDLNLSGTMIAGDILKEWKGLRLITRRSQVAALLAASQFPLTAPSEDIMS
ncbi:hypothetical protein [Octadecabacter antarcticus]|uniref:hypothetical protein n=1 Tax=Octadecabacter antarcticus TaxID=1217908 RepID=UPI0002D71553|nr:hypothetical protein [Octadecabacter antarcticus]